MNESSRTTTPFTDEELKVLKEQEHGTLLRQIEMLRTYSSRKEIDAAVAQAKEEVYKQTVKKTDTMNEILIDVIQILIDDKKNHHCYD